MKLLVEIEGIHFTEAEQYEREAKLTTVKCGDTFLRHNYATNKMDIATWVDQKDRIEPAIVLTEIGSDIDGN